MPNSDWSQRSLGSLCTFTGGGAFPREHQGAKTGDYPFVKVSDLALKENTRRVRVANNWVSKNQIKTMKSKLMPPGSVIFAKIGEGLKAERLSTLSVPTAIDNNLMAAIPFEEEVDSDYLYYLLSQVGLSDWAQGSALPYLRQSDLELIPVHVPPLLNQRRVAETLGAIDDLIGVNAQAINNLADLLTVIYQQMIENSPCTDRPLFDVVDIDYGAAYKGSFFTQSGIGLPLLRIRDLKTFTSDTWTTERVPGDTVVSPGDVVVGMDAEFRPTYWLGSKSLLNQRVCRVRPKRGGLVFARESLVKPLAFIEGHKTGTTVSHLNKADLLEITIPTPPDSILESFQKITEPLADSLVRLHFENKDLEATRDELLPLVISGRVRVREVEPE